MSTLAKAAEVYRLHVVAFGDAGPGASPLVPFRSAEITFNRGHPSARWITLMTDLLNAQAQPVHPTSVNLLHATGGREFLLIEYAAPSPLGLGD
jgi:hypothetical protein